MKFLATVVACGLSGLALAAPTATIDSLEKRGPNDVCLLKSVSRGYKLT
jgi:pectate lyase